MFKCLFFSSEWHFIAKKKGKKHIKQNFELYLHILLTFEIIFEWELVKLLDYKIISIFMKD